MILWGPLFWQRKLATYSSSSWVHFTAIVGVVLLLAIFIGIPTLVIKMRRRAMIVPGRAYTRGILESGKVHFIFHRYSGFLVFVFQRRYDAVMPVDDAEVLLKELVRHNLTWGILAYGGVLVPIFTFAEWRSQKKRNLAARHSYSAMIAT